MLPSRTPLPLPARRWPGSRLSFHALLVLGVAAAAGGVGAMVWLDPSGSVWLARLTEWFALSGATVPSGRWWQFVTFGGLPPPLLPLLASLLALSLAGREVEPILGRGPFALLFALGQLLGGLAQWGLIVAGLTPAGAHVAGVCGGAAAVLAAGATILPEMEARCLLFFILPVRVRARHLGGAVLGFSLLWCGWQPGAAWAPAGVVTGLLFGWGYVRGLGYGRPLGLQRHLVERRREAERLERMPAEEFIREQLDPILEKIARNGSRRLTRGERRLLQQGRTKLVTRDSVCSSASR